MKQNMKIYLIGFMGSGKSTIGRLLAKEMDVPLYEMDELLEKQAKMKIKELFARYGEAHFREIESSLLQTLSKKQSGIVSCGGGVVLKEENRQVMRQSGTVILLQAEPEEIYARVVRNENRPLLAGHMNLADIQEMMENRTAYYEQAAHHIIHTTGLEKKEIVRHILEAAGIRDRVSTGLH